MLDNLINFSLVFSICSYLVVLVLWIYRRPHLPVMDYAAGLAALLALDHLTLLALFNYGAGAYSLWLTRLHLALAVLILALVHQLVQRFTLNKPLLKPTSVSIAITAIGLIISAVYLGGFLRLDSLDAKHLILPPIAMAILALYYILTTLSAYLTLRHRFVRSSELVERIMIARISVSIFPLGAFFFACMFLLPHLGFGQLFYFFAGIPLAVMVYLCVVRFRLLKISRWQATLYPLFLLVCLVYGLFYLQPQVVADFPMQLAAIGLLVLAAISGQMILVRFQKFFEGDQSAYEALMDEKMEEFSEDLGKLMTRQQLWAYLADFYQKHLQMDAIAIIIPQNDITPYKIAYCSGFKPREVQLLLESSKFSLMDQLENEGHIMQKSDLPDQHPMTRALDEAGVVLALPLLRRAQLQGAILLGSRQPTPVISKRNLHIYRLIGAQTAASMEKIRMLEETFQAQKMAGLGMFASQLAHDFRSFIALSKLQLRQQPNPRLEKHAVYMEKMIEGLLNYARPQELSLKPVDINQLIDLSLDMMTFPNSVHLEKHYDTSLPRLMLDSTQMRRVFHNLFENSLRAMRTDEEARLKITTKPLRSLSKRQPSPWVHIEILDDGYGIDEEYLERIFDPFFTTLKKEGGSGFGLAIVKQIINRHSGHIDVSSRKGRGTVFNIRLPYQPAGSSGMTHTSTSDQNAPSAVVTAQDFPAGT